MRKPLSISTAKTVMRCGHQYQLRQEFGPMAPGVAMIKGRGLDRAANANNMQKATSRVDLDEDELVSVAADEVELAFHDVVAFTEEERSLGSRKVAGATKDQAVSLTRVYRKQLAPLVQPGILMSMHGAPPTILGAPITIVPVPAVQARITATVDGLELVGVLDLIDEDGVVRDLKSAAKSPVKNAAQVSAQLQMYSVLNRVLNKHPFGRAALDTVVLTPAGKAHVDVQEVRHGPAEQASMIARLHAVAEAIEKEVFIPTDPSNWWCSERFCGFYAVCKYVQRGATRPTS